MHGSVVLRHTTCLGKVAGALVVSHGQNRLEVSRKPKRRVVGYKTLQIGSQGLSAQALPFHHPQDPDFLLHPCQVLVIYNHNLPFPLSSIFEGEVLR